MKYFELYYTSSQESIDSETDGFGIRNYSVKPINGESIKLKAFEILKY